MLLPVSTETVLCDHLCRERTGATPHLGCAALHAVLYDFLRGNDPTQAKSWRERLRKTADAAGVSARCQGIKTGGHRTLEREVAIDIVFDDHELIRAGQGDDGTASLLTQRGAQRIMECWDSVEQANSFTLCLQRDKALLQGTDAEALGVCGNCLQLYVVILKHM